MQLQFKDYHNAGTVIQDKYESEWNELVRVLEAMPLHLKESDQRGKQGTPIFDPVGTNEYIKDHLTRAGWLANIPIPQELSFLGTDIDFAKSGVIAEVQFSNYPFLLNNVLRSNLFFRSKTHFSTLPTEVIIIITKAWMFPASNSTLYYEQGVNQLDALVQYSAFDVPIRIVGLFEGQNVTVPATWTEYTAKRYSRTVHNRTSRQCLILPGSGRSRCTFRVL